MVARRFRVSRPTVAKWVRRFREAGADGLEGRNSAPHRHPRRTAPELEQRICAVRRSEGFGPHRIAWALGLARSTVYAVLRRFGLSRLDQLHRVSRRKLRYEHPAPGDLLHIDVKKLGRIPEGGGHRVRGRSARTPRTRGLDYLHVAVDDHSRYAYVEALPDERGVSCAAFLQRALNHFRARGVRVRRVLTDIQSGPTLRMLAGPAGRSQDQRVRHPPAVVDSPSGAQRDSWAVDHEAGGTTAGDEASCWEPGDRARRPGSLLANVRYDVPSRWPADRRHGGVQERTDRMQYWLGIDVASRAAHQASLADGSGRFLWSGHRFRTEAEDLKRLWAMLPQREEDAEVLVILEPTRNAWVALAAWFRRRGARVVLVPPERSSDLRDYYHKHTKSDRLDSRLLARLPLLHPEGLHDEHGLGPGDPLRRATRLRQSLVQRRTKSLARLDALLELLGPKWLEAFGERLSNKTPLRFLAAGYACPDTVKRLGRARLARFLHRHSRGQWGAEGAAALLAAAEETLALWEGAFDFDQLAEDIAVEARIALSLGEDIAALELSLLGELLATDG